MIAITVQGISLSFHTDPKLFSPGGLDEGTAAMLACAVFSPDDKVLDLGCGYGVVGIFAAKRIGAERVTLCDIDPAAVRCAARNAALNGVPGIRVIQSNAFQNIDDAGFTLILSNPPYHVDFSVPKAFVEKGFNRLALGGKMLMVTKRKEWYKNKFTSVFGGVTVREINGYHVFMGEKRSHSYASAKASKARG